ncbi:MAG: hypothetical protein J7M16_05355 [Anaerolineae bacterium]|nr:hypothetical protein [Anaerolineae bacterium]
MRPYAMVGNPHGAMDGVIAPPQADGPPVISVPITIVCHMSPRKGTAVPCPTPRRPHPNIIPYHNLA